VTSYEPPDDPSEAPTGKFDDGDDDQYGPQPDGSTPWHRKPAALIGLGVLVAALLALVILGIIELTRESGSSTPASTSTTTPTPVTTSSTAPTPSATSTLSTEPVAPAPTTTASTAPTTTAPTTTAPTTTTSDDGHHHHHHHDGGATP
jgi:cytoskeletal protein RodZ